MENVGIKQDLVRSEKEMGTDRYAEQYLNRFDSHGGIKVDEIVMNDRVGLRARQDQCGNACSELNQRQKQEIKIVCESQIEFLDLNQETNQCAKLHT